jgi:uncharacterized protein YdaU (DUF1376 family)
VSDAPFVNFYTSDFLAGTSGLTASTKGIYITLLCLMYEAEAPLSQSWETLARRCGCTLPAFQKAIETLQDDGKVVASDAGLWSPKCEKHITLRRERQSSAKAAAEKRWGKDKQNQRAGDASAMPKQCKPEPEPYIREEPKGSLSSGDDEIAVAVEAYNDAAEDAGWPKVQVLSKTRRSAIKARLSECGGIAGWRDALARARASPHLCGQNDRGWTADFDFLTRQSAFTKLMEGSYDPRDRRSSHAAQGRTHRTDPALEQIARLAGLGQASGAGRA